MDPPGGSIPAIDAYVNRVRGLGWPVLATGLALVLGILALTQPVWVFQRDAPGGDVEKRTYGWTVLVEENWEGGAWSSTTYTPYTSPNFSDFRMREAIGASYTIGAAYAAVLFVLIVLHFLNRSRRVPLAALLVVNAAALALAVLAIAYPALTIPTAAALDVNSVVAGFSGTAVGAGSRTFTWGPGATWWVWIASGLLTLVVFLVPLMQRKPWSRVIPAH